MKVHDVTLSRRARNQLGQIELWIAGQTSPQVAERFVARVMAHIATFDLAPRRGHRVSRATYRSGWARTLTVIVRVRGLRAEVMGLHYRGQALPSDTEPP